MCFFPRPFFSLFIFFPPRYFFFPLGDNRLLHRIVSFSEERIVSIENRSSLPSIGRITEGLLTSIAETVDVVEPIPKFTAQLASKPGVGLVQNVGLEEWRPPQPKDGEEKVVYDVIWNQWCLGHLTDDQLVEYLLRCKEVLEPEMGFIVVKENMSTMGGDVFDDEDSSVTR